MFSVWYVGACADNGQPTTIWIWRQLHAVNNGYDRFQGEYFVSSHDPQFIDTIANRIIEIREVGIIDKMCSYDEFLEFKLNMNLA